MNIRTCLLIASACWLTASAVAFELDWASEGWVSSTAATQNQILSNVDGSGIDVSISLVLSGASNFGGPTNVSGGNLLLGVDYPNRNRVNNFIDVTINFSSRVHWVSFDLNDVDKGGDDKNAYWEDVIENISGAGISGPVTASATWGSVITPDSSSDPGETLYRGNRNDGWSSSSRLNLSWSNAVDSVTFRYSGGENTRSNPNYQVIGLSGIHFYEYHPVPEPGTVLMGAFTALSLIGVSILRRRSKQARTQA